MNDSDFIDKHFTSEHIEKMEKCLYEMDTLSRTEKYIEVFNKIVNERTPNDSWKHILGLRSFTILGVENCSDIEFEKSEWGVNKWNNITYANYSRDTYVGIHNQTFIGVHNNPFKNLQCHLLTKRAFKRHTKADEETLNTIDTFITTDKYDIELTIENFPEILKICQETHKKNIRTFLTSELSRHKFYLPLFDKLAGCQ